MKIKKKELQEVIEEETIKHLSCKLLEDEKFKKMCSDPNVFNEESFHSLTSYAILKLFKENIIKSNVMKNLVDKEVKMVIETCMVCCTWAGNSKLNEILSDGKDKTGIDGIDAYEKYKCSMKK